MLSRRFAPTHQCIVASWKARSYFVCNFVYAESEDFILEETELVVVVSALPPLTISPRSSIKGAKISKLRLSASSLCCTALFEMSDTKPMSASPREEEESRGGIVASSTSNFEIPMFPIIIVVVDVDVGRVVS